MLIIGTMIGAGFASGQEIVSFFGASYISPFVALVCGVLIAAFSFLFLYIGHKTKATDISQVNQRLFGKLHVPADIFLLFNSAVVLAGMLAGMDALGALLFPIQPLYSIVAGILCAFISYRGLKGLLKCNAVLIPVVVVLLIVVCALHIGRPLATPVFALRLPTCLIYVAMNMILAATVLATTDIPVKTAAICSVLAGAVMGLLLLLIILALNASGAYASMPVLNLARKIPALFYAMTAVIAAAIFTTMLTSASGLTDWLAAQTSDRKFSSAVVLLAGLILSNLGFETVVAFLYPVIGVIGLLYLTAALLYATVGDKIQAVRARRALRSPRKKRKIQNSRIVFRRKSQCRRN